MRNAPIAPPRDTPLAPATVPPGVAAGSYLPELEALRGIAMLLVFWFHVDALIWPILPASTPPLGILRSWVRAGHAGVDLFFVLSAFLLSRPFLREAAGGPHADLHRYARRRVLRIVPAYWLAVAVGTLVRAAEPADLLRALPQLVFLGSFTPHVTGELFPFSAVWWSLCTEFQLYLALPIIAWWAYPGWRRRAAVGVLCGLLAAHVLLLLSRFPTSRLWITGLEAYNSILGRSPSFLVGIAAAELHRRYGTRVRAALTRSRAWSTGGADLLLLVVLVVLGRELRWYANAGAAPRIVAWYQTWHTLVAALWASVLLLLVLAPLRSKRLFVNPFLEWCGKVSYSVYLIHVPFMFHALRWGFQLLPQARGSGWSPATWGIVVVATLGCFALASLTYRFVELPFLRRKDEWAR